MFIYSSIHLQELWLKIQSFFYLGLTTKNINRLNMLDISECGECIQSKEHLA